MRKPFVHQMTIGLALTLYAWLGYGSTGALSATGTARAERPALAPSRLLQAPNDPACNPFWIGAHGWGTMIADDVSPAATVQAPLTRLRFEVVAAMQNGHILSVEGHSAIVPWPGRAPTPNGDVLLEALDSFGHVIGAWGSGYYRISSDFSLRPPATDGDANVSVTITPEFERQIAALRATYHGQSVTRHARTPGPIRVQVVATDTNHVAVSFDCSHYSELDFHHATETEQGDFLGNEPCGDDRGTHYGVLAIADPDVYVNFQDGVKTVAHLVKFHVIGR